MGATAVNRYAQSLAIPWLNGESTYEHWDGPARYSNKQYQYVCSNMNLQTFLQATASVCSGALGPGRVLSGGARDALGRHTLGFSVLSLYLVALSGNS